MEKISVGEREYEVSIIRGKIVKIENEKGFGFEVTPMVDGTFEIHARGGVSIKLKAGNCFGFTINN